MMSVQEFELYDKLEENYWWFKARRKILSVFLDLIENKETKTILEIGCGTGGNLKYLFNEFRHIIGLEYNDEAISFAKNKLPKNTVIVKGDANCLNIRGKSVDCVAMLDVLYHKNIKNVDNVLIQVTKILKKDGYLLITDGAFNFLQGKHSKNVDSVRRFTKRELISKLKKLNYHIVKASYWGISLFFLLFIKRTILEKFFRTTKNAEHFDFKSVPIFDDFLFFLVSNEKHILRKFSLPLGSSLCILARKTEPAF
jgi:ubiquinone/menaquinone biosynthesis C-methylase UbiE